MLLVALCALAAPSAGTPPEVRLSGFVIPSASFLQDDAASLTDQDGFALLAEAGADGVYEPARLGIRFSAGLLPEVLLKDAVVVWQPVPQLRVDAGQFKVPLGVAYLPSESRRQLPWLAAAPAEVGTRDIGLALTGSLVLGDRSWAQYTTGAFNGEGANRIQNVNQRFLLTQRLLLTPFGTRNRVMESSDGSLYLGLGGGWTWNVVGDGASAEEINQFAGELQFAWKPLSLQAEVLAGDHFYANADLQDYAFLGGYGQLGCFVPVGWAARHVELVARVGWNDPDTGSEGAAEGPVLPATLEVSGGLSIYAFADPGRFHDLKFQLAYGHFDETEGAEAANDRLLAQAVARF